MSMALSERIVNRLVRRHRPPTASRRGFLGGAALVGAALATDPLSYLTRPANAYDAICGSGNTCAEGYSVFCCTINNGQNSCPPDSFIGGWWKADNSSFCGGTARYYVDCNAYRDNHYTCHCNTTTCDQRLVACNQFRYGQCSPQISYANTGPVVCRVISCAPPWQQFAGTCGASSATDNNTATHNAPCLIGKPPRGAFDSVTAVGNTVRVRGWAFDPDQPTKSINIAVYMDGHGLVTSTTAVLRADVNAAFKVTGRHGFDISFNAPSGTHQVRVYAINIAGGTGNPLLGTRTVAVNPGVRPIGHLDSTFSVGNTVRLRGWAFDADQPGVSLKVHVYQDGHLAGYQSTAVPRPDVNAAYRITGTHGFDITVKATNGAHRFDVYGINVGGGSGNPLIGAKALVVNPGARPIGHLDSVTAIGNSVRITGWAFDADQPAASINVAVYSDGHGISWYPAATPRPDVDAAYRITGAHGFDITLTAANGVHTFAVYGINIAGGSGNPLLGQHTLAVNQRSPLGALDTATVLSGNLHVVGWAFDPDQSAVQSTVAVYIDGNQHGPFPTGQARPDVNRHYGITGSHGYHVIIPLTGGPHSIKVAALDVSGAAPNTFIGSRTVE